MAEQDRQPWGGEFHPESPPPARPTEEEQR